MACSADEAGTRERAQLIWDYMHMGHSLEGFEADGIMTLCSHDTRVAEHAAHLFLSGVGKWLLFSGGFGTGPHSGKELLGWTRPEAEIFADIAIKAGVPQDKVLVENVATNTGENVKFSQKLLLEKGIPSPSKLVIVQKPFMERRSFATFKKVWPEPEIRITSPNISFDQYPNDEISRETVTNIMVGDMQRIKLYAPPHGDFQIAQEIPEQVWKTFEELVTAGFTWNLIK